MKKITHYFFYLFIALLLLVNTSIVSAECNNNGVCDSGEDPWLCASDCGKTSNCGDGICDPQEIGTCVQDCKIEQNDVATTSGESKNNQPDTNTATQNAQENTTPQQNQEENTGNNQNTNTAQIETKAPEKTCQETNNGVEICDLRDNDCDGRVDEGVCSPACTNKDDDGYDACNIDDSKDTDGLSADCDDQKDTVNPGAIETCNDVDDNCDGTIDENIQQMCFDETKVQDFAFYTAGTSTCSKGKFGPCEGQNPTKTFSFGEKIFVKGSMQGIQQCSTGQSEPIFYLKEPSGGIFPLELYNSQIQKSQKDINEDKLLVDLIHNFNAQFTVGPENSPGKYQFIVDVPYTCWEYLVYTPEEIRSIPVNWRGDNVKSVGFFLEENVNYNKWDPLLPMSFRGSTTSSNTFELDVPAPITLRSNGNAVDCEINGNKVHLEGNNILDVTELVKEGKNTVTCTANTGVVQNCKGTSTGNDNCGCFYKKTVRISCPPNVVCGTMSHDQNKCYIPPPEGTLDVVLARHPDNDIFWSNDGQHWYYGKLPLKEYIRWKTSPNQFIDDKIDRINEGVWPWDSDKLFVRKWLFPEYNENVIRISSPNKIDCTLNSKHIDLEENIDEKWSLKSFVQFQQGKNLLACSLEKGPGNFFDVDLVQASPIQAQSPLKWIIEKNEPLKVELQSTGMIEATIFAYLEDMVRVVSADFINKTKINLAFDPSKLKNKEYPLELIIFDENNKLSYAAKSTIQISKDSNTQDQTADNTLALLETLLYESPAERTQKFLDVAISEGQKAAEIKQTIANSNKVWEDHFEYAGKQHTERVLRSEQLRIDNFLKSLSGSVEEKYYELEQYIKKEGSDYTEQSISYLQAVLEVFKIETKVKKQLEEDAKALSQIQKVAQNAIANKTDASIAVQEIKNIGTNNEISEYVKLHANETAIAILNNDHASVDYWQSVVDDFDSMTNEFVNAFETQDWGKAITYAPAVALDFIVGGIARIALFWEKINADVPTSSDEQFDAFLEGISLVPIGKIGKVGKVIVGAEKATKIASALEKYKRLIRRSKLIITGDRLRTIEQIGGKFNVIKALGPDAKTYYVKIRRDIYDPGLERIMYSLDYIKDQGDAIIKVPKSRVVDVNGKLFGLDDRIYTAIATEDVGGKTLFDLLEKERRVTHNKELSALDFFRNTKALTTDQKDTIQRRIIPDFMFNLGDRHFGNIVATTEGKIAFIDHETALLMSPNGPATIDEMLSLQTNVWTTSDNFPQYKDLILRWNSGDLQKRKEIINLLQPEIQKLQKINSETFDYAVNQANLDHWTLDKVKDFKANLFGPDSKGGKLAEFIQDFYNQKKQIENQLKKIQ